MNDDLALRLLRGLNPVPDEAAAAVPDEEARERLERILAGGSGGAGSTVPFRQTHSRGAARRVRRTLLLAAALFAIGSVAWAVMVGGGADPAQAVCFAAAGLDGERAVVFVGEDVDPVDACATAWPALWETEPPDLVACMLESGVPGVFPAGGTQTCARLRLEEFYQVPVPDPAADLLRRLEALLAQQRCADVDEVARVAREFARDLGLDDWRVEVAGAAGPATPCASVAFDLAAATVVVVAIPPSPDADPSNDQGEG